MKMMKFFLVLLSCGLILGQRSPLRTIARASLQGRHSALTCRVSNEEFNNVQSIPWEDLNTETLLKNDDFIESSVSEDPAGTREEMTVNATADFVRGRFRPFNFYYHQNPCYTTATYERLTSAINVGGRRVTVLFPDNFQQIKCRNVPCHKCPGKCVQKYKFEMALVRDRCRVRWDRVKVPSGCCCHHYLPYFFLA